MNRPVRICVALAVGLVLALAAAPGAAQTIPDPETTLLRDLELEVLVAGPDVRDPTAIDVTSDGRVLIAERTGRVKIWHQDGRLVEAGRIGVDSRQGQCNDCPGQTLDEGGLHGLLLDPDFDDNGHLFLYYSVPNSVGVPPVPAKHPDARGPDDVEGKFRLSRLTLDGEALDLDSEVVLFENPAEWFYCCHYGGDMDWLPDGTLLLSTGDDTISSQSGGFAPRDYREGFEHNNADLTSQNLADRRGKLLRLDVRDVFDDGSVIPPDNPFVGIPYADPSVYALGFRSPYRFAVDPRTGNAFVGNVGPDGKAPDPRRGPEAYEELEEVPLGGGTNHGWPRCIANNVPYNDYDHATGQAGPPLSCDGMTPASLYYTYNPQPAGSPWVQMGVGGTCMAIMGGEVYLRPESGALSLPERFDGQLLWLEWCRGIVVATPIGSGGRLDTRPDQVRIVYGGGLSSPMPNTALTPYLRSPIDAAVGPDGALYIAEYAARNYNAGNSRVSRLKCAGCSPDPADYGGADVLPAISPPQLAGVLPASGAGSHADSGLAGAGRAGPLAAGVLGLGLALTLGLARRRTVT